MTTVSGNKDRPETVVRKTVVVNVPQAHAFAAFTEHHGEWWPLEKYHIGARPPQTAILEPRPRGRWFERADDGSECDWGRVLVWEPPSRIVLSWEIGSDWKHDPNLTTEVEIRFVADGEDRTRVELEHRGLDAYGARRDEMRGIFDSDRGWKGLLDAFAARASEGLARGMTNAAHPPIKLFQFPRMFGIPNVSPFCCKLETWLRIARVPYEVVDTPDPRKGPRGKLPFIEDAGVRIADTSLIIDHLTKTRGVDPDARLNASQRAIALLVQRTLEEHYAFVLAYTHFVRDEGWQHMRARFDSLPSIVRPLVRSLVRGRVRKMLWTQGVLRHSHEAIVESALRDWRAVLTVMSDGPFFFGEEPTRVDAIVFGALATSVLTPIESPIRAFLRAQPALVAYAERMLARFFPELATAPSPHAAPASGRASAVQLGT